MTEGSGRRRSREGLHGRSRACIEAAQELLFQDQMGAIKLGFFSKLDQLFIRIFKHIRKILKKITLQNVKSTKSNNHNNHCWDRKHGYIKMGFWSYGKFFQVPQFLEREGKGERGEERERDKHREI